MARRTEPFDCEIKGCTQASYRGPMCRKHKKLVPMGMVIEQMVEGMTASHRIASKHRKRQLAFVRAKIASGEAV